MLWLIISWENIIFRQKKNDQRFKVALKSKLFVNVDCLYHLKVSEEKTKNE